MELVFPLKLDDFVLVHDIGSGIRIHTKIIDFHMIEGRSVEFCCSNGNDVVSGYDSSDNNNGKGLRFTNIVSVEFGVPYKLCPMCENSYPFVTYSTRTTDEVRDQSDCFKCRKKRPTLRSV